jgi:hypothetical protein
VASFEFVEPKQTPEEAVKFLQETFFPLCQEFWEKCGRSWFGADKWDIPMFNFIDLWMSGTLVLTAASDGSGAPAGFLIGGKVRPLFHKSTILKIEAWYGRDEETRKGLFRHLGSIMKYLGVDRIQVPDFGQGRPELGEFSRELSQPGWVLAR